MTMQKFGVINGVGMCLSKYVLFLMVLSTLIFPVKSQTSNVVTILADDDYPPYSYVENGVLKGIYIELLRRAITPLQREYFVEIVPMPWKRALLSAKQGNVVGIIPPYRHSEKRPFISSYSIALGTEHVVTYCRQNIDLESALALKLPSEKRLHLGMNAGYLLLNQRYKKAIQSGYIKLWENKSTEANVIKLLTDKLDCYVNDRNATLYELDNIKRSNPELSHIIVEEKDEISQQTAHIGFSQGVDKEFIFKMNDALLGVMHELDVKKSEPLKP